MDAYIKECVGGDQTIGRVTAGLDLSQESFAILPPHFRSGNDRIVREALVAIWGDEPDSLLNLDGIEPLLQRVTASLVHGYTWLLECVDRDNQGLGDGSLEDADAAFDTLQLLFNARLASYNEDQRALIKRSVKAAVCSRSSIRSFDMGDVALHDAHADLDRPPVMKASIPVNAPVPLEQITSTRYSFDSNPLEIQIQGTVIASCGTMHRRDDNILIHINQDHPVFDCPLFQNAELLGLLRSIVSTSPSDVISRASGVPLMVALRRDMMSNHATGIAKERANDVWREAAMAEVVQLRSEMQPERQAARWRGTILEECRVILQREASERGIITAANLG